MSRWESDPNVADRAPVRAAQYVRMSTEHQKYSTENQADIIQAYDQESLAVGSSFAVTPSSKLKLEWANTRIGQRSAMVDSPAGGDPVRRQRIQVLSLNYSFVF